MKHCETEFVFRCGLSYVAPCALHYDNEVSGSNTIGLPNFPYASNLHHHIPKENFNFINTTSVNCVDTDVSYPQGEWEGLKTLVRPPMFPQ